MLYSLVDAGVVPPLAREAKHAADDSAVELAPLGVTDLLPLAAILHLHVALGHRDALAIRGQDSMDADVLHLDIEVLKRKPDRKKGSHVLLFQQQFYGNELAKKWTGVFVNLAPRVYETPRAFLQSDVSSTHVHYFLRYITSSPPPHSSRPFQTAASCSSPHTACKSSPGCSDILAPSHLVNVKHLDRLPCDCLWLQEPMVFQRQHGLHRGGVGVRKVSAVRGQEAGRQPYESKFLLVAGEAVVC